MSLTRRLRRLARAHLGDLRTHLLGDDDPLDDVLDDAAAPSAASGASAGSSGASQRTSRSASRSASTAGASASAAEQVPPDVAKAYRALEVPVGSDRRAVKKGYRRMMKKYHQDRFDEDPERRAVAGEVSKRLNAAYETVTEYLDATER